MKAEIKTERGRERIFVNGEPILSDSYITYLTGKARYLDFAERGYRLFSFPAFFSSKTLNENAQYPAFGEGIFDMPLPKWEIFDRNVEKILEACPDAYIFPRVNLSPAEAWERENSDELCDIKKGEVARPCFASEALEAEMKRMLGLLIDHVKSADYREHIIGYQLASGNTEEWLPFDMAGCIGKRSRERFGRYRREKGITDSEAEYYGFLSEVTAELILRLAAFTKERTEGDLLVGTFYGYTLECPDRRLCHAALGRLLDSESIDFICSPVSYGQGRALGRDHGFMLPVDSLKLHGKLYMSENDTRTHMTRSPFPSNPYFDAPIFQPIGKDTAYEMLKLHYSRAMIRGVGHWWFDMFGGWYRDEDHLDLMAGFLEISREAAEIPSGGVSEIAVFVDERSFRYISDSSAGYSVCYDIREALGKIGAPYDIYLADDYDRVKDSYKLVILLEPEPTELSESIASDALALGKGLLRVTPQNAKEVTPEEIRRISRQNGVHLYFDEDTLVYVNESYIFAHFTKDGRHILKIPENCKLYDVLEKKYVAPELDGKAKTGILLKLERKNA